jgi:hypothetical protein
VAAQTEGAQIGDALPVAGTAVPVIVTPIPLEVADRERQTVGQLTFRGGLSLASTSPEFGGLSSLVVLGDDATVLAISDRGTWFTARLQHEDGKLTGIADVESAPMLDWRGKPLIFGENDSEGLAATAHEVYVSFEGFHRIWRYAISGIREPQTVFGQTAIALKEFDGLKAQPKNGGIEALTALPDGSLLAVSEESRTKTGDARAWLFKGDEAKDLALADPGKFRPSDATTLSDGGVLILERSFSFLEGLGARIVHIPAADIKAGNVMHAEVLAELAPPLSVDNMEGIAAVPDPEGPGYRIYLVSDDNFNPLQRTLLMEFSWMPGATEPPQ